MKCFKMCSECQKEYEEPGNRRFHAQPNACPVCGPQVWLVDSRGSEVARGDGALRKLTELLKEGKIIAVKGLGGFHLICDATNEEAVRELRRRKRREEKPFAVMFKGVEQVREYAELSHLEEVALTGVESPIVILKRKGGLAPSVSPDTETVGAFLPYTPLHHIILRDFGRPIVATSCNYTDEPIVKDNSEALELLGKVADFALLHDREIVRRCDDSVVRVIGGKVVPLRRSRGYAPLPLLLDFSLKRRVLAVGPHMKSTVALGEERRVYISQHIGDIDNPKAEEFLRETIDSLLELYEFEPQVVVCDYHPGYYSTKLAKELALKFGAELLKLYHHHGHVISVMAENHLKPEEEVIGLAFDGTGYGRDGTIWGGEFLLATYREFERVFSLLPFKLVGGDRAVKEPYRVAISLLLQVGREPEELLNVEPKKLNFLKKALERGINSPLTSSMGRLFDGISAILGLRYRVSYQAQGAILLEELASKSSTRESYPVKLTEDRVDWREMVAAVLEELDRGVPKEEIARKFHNWVVESSVKVCTTLKEERGVSTVALSGGVFQNRLLTESLAERLKEEGFRVVTHQIVPPNDGGLSLGQAVYGGLA